MHPLTAPDQQPDAPVRAAVMAALALQAAGRPVDEESLRQMLQAMQMPCPDGWLLAAICRLAEAGCGRPARAAAQTGLPQPEAVPNPAPGPQQGRGAGDAVAVPRAEALYLYALAPAERLPSLSCRGLDGEPVEVVKAGGWAAAVHRCAGRPYTSQRREQVLLWVQQHHAVVEQAARRAGDVIPVTFNTIVLREGEPAAKTLRQWLRSRAARLKALLERVAGCQEFGVQLLRQSERAERALVSTHEELQRLSRTASRSPSGTGYLLNQQLHDKLHRSLQEQGQQVVRQLRGELEGWCRQLRDEKTREVGEGLQMVAHFSCLVPRTHQADFQRALQSMRLPEGYSVRCSGPWPPYSFVSLGELSPGGGRP